MSVKILEDARQHPARDAAMFSINAIHNKDRDAWLSMWDDNGIIEDPVGKSPLDPEGNGHQGKDAITAFYDNIIGPNDLRFTIRQSFAAGSECANVGTITVKGPDGSITRTELVIVYRINDEGKVLSLRAFWEFDDTVASIF